MKRMSTRSQLTKDLNDSIKSSVGNKVKILFKNVVRLETKGDKTENRVLVFSPCRILLLTAKVPTKIDTHFHYLEIQALESKRGNQLSLTVNDKVYSFLCGEDSTCSTEVDNMIGALSNAIRNIFPTVPLQHIIKKIEVIPMTRLQQLRDLEAIASSRREVGPCGGFSAQYACMCDYHSIPYREEVAWDIDNIYVALNTRELSFKDFDYLDQKDLLPIISALEYNTWFTRLKVNQVRLSHDNMERVLYVAKRSLNLEGLFLENLNLKADFCNKLSGVLKANTGSALHTLDLSNNSLEDKGASYLAGAIARMGKGLVHLGLSHCSLSSKGVGQLATALVATGASTLTHFDLSGNSLKDDLTGLHNFLSQASALQHLDISSTDAILENLFGSLVRGCTTNLVHLNVSRNPFSSKKSKEAPIALKQFFSTTLSLKYLNMAHCKLPQEALKNLLLGLACNEFTKEMTLDISNNNLGSQGAHVLESCVHGVRCISGLDISENNMDGDLAGVLLAIGKNRSLRKLTVGRSMKKHGGPAVDALVQLLQDEECTLRSLHIPDCRLRSDLYNLLSALGDNRSLETLELTGNAMGDQGARLLAKALQINTSLANLSLDRNGITTQGYQELAYALESNRSLRHIPFPLHDVAPCMKQSAAGTELLWRRIQESLERNVSLQTNAVGGKNKGAQGPPMQPSFLLISKQQALERLASQCKDFDGEMDQATEAALEDAAAVKQLPVRLQEAAQRGGGGGGGGEHPVEAKLREAAREVHRVVEEQMKVTMDRMLRCCRELCPQLLRDERLLDEIGKECLQVPQQPSLVDLITAAVQHRAARDILDRVREVNLSRAAQLSEQVTDEVYESLMRSYRVLSGAPDTGGAIRIDSPPCRRSRLSSDSGGSTRPTDGINSLDASATDLSHHSTAEHSPMATPHMSMKRRSIHGNSCAGGIGRKLRPKSVVDSVEGLSADDIPSLLPRRDEEEDSVTELPNATQQLQHLVKGRPRRAKTRAPTRPLVRPPEPVAVITAYPSEDLQEGLDTFFRPGSVTPTSDGGGDQRDYASPTPSLDKMSSRPTVGANHHHSPLLKGLLTPTPRSRSSDHLEHQDSCSDAESIAAEHSPKQSCGGPRPPRPWSMEGAKPAELSLLSDGSSPNNSTGNTPDSAEALDSSESSSKSNRDLRIKRSGIVRSYLQDRSSLRLLSRKKGIASEGNNMAAVQECIKKDDNHNCCSGSEEDTRLLDGRC